MHYIASWLIPEIDIDLMSSPPDNSVHFVDLLQLTTTVSFTNGNCMKQIIKEYMKKVSKSKMYTKYLLRWGYYNPLYKICMINKYKHSKNERFGMSAIPSLTRRKSRDPYSLCKVWDREPFAVNYSNMFFISNRFIIVPDHKCRSH